MTINKNKSGYKHTKVGWIPKEWKVETIGNVFDYLKTYSFSRANLNYENGTILNIHYGDLHTKFSKNFHVDIDENTIQLPYITDENSLSEDSFLRTGDLILADASEDYEGVGQCVEVNILGDSKVTAGLHTFALRDSNNQTSERYRSYIFQNEKVKKQIKRIATGISVLGISKKNLSTISIPLPPMREQKKIAEILSTWDEAIETTDKLIVAQEQRKKWLMQQLLTGKSRFSGFSAKWKRVELGEVAEIVMGQSPSSKYYNKKELGLPLVQGNLDIKNRKTIKRVWTEEITKTSEENDIILSVRAPVGKIAISSFKSCIGRGVCSISAHSIDRVYLFHYLIWFESIWEKLSQGSTFSSISSADIRTQIINTPSLKEQEKIAEVLSKQDELIEGLRDEKQRLVEQKRGLMQVLLTGAVRV